MEHESNDKPATDPQPLPLLAPLTGHLTIAFLMAPVAVFFVWLSTKLPWVPEAPFATIAWTTVCAILASVVVTVLCERPLVVKRGLAGPGGWDFALLPVGVSILVGFGVGVVGMPTVAGAGTVAIVLGVLAVVEMLFLETWKPGETQEWHHDRWEEFKDLTKETFSEDVDNVKRRAAEKARERYYRKHPRD